MDPTAGAPRAIGVGAGSPFRMDGWSLGSSMMDMDTQTVVMDEGAASQSPLMIPAGILDTFDADATLESLVGNIPAPPHTHHHHHHRHRHHHPLPLRRQPPFQPLVSDPPSVEPDGEGWGWVPRPPPQPPTHARGVIDPTPPARFLVLRPPRMMTPTNGKVACSVNSTCYRKISVKPMRGVEFATLPTPTQ